MSPKPDRRAALLAAILASLGACGEHAPTGKSTAADASLPDAEVPDADPFCHIDCFGFHGCVDGVVTTWEHTPVACDDWEGECPHRESYQCEQGCRTDTDRIDDAFIEAAIMCEENRPKMVGDPCTDDLACRPEVATWDFDDNVTNVYLECDTNLEQCVARPAPVVSDWLAPCGLGLDDTGPSYGFVETSACSGGYCLFLDQASCVAQGCTIACEGDGECPIGSVCEPFWGVCKPGPPRKIGIDLQCP